MTLFRKDHPFSGSVCNTEKSWQSLCDYTEAVSLLMQLKQFSDLLLPVDHDVVFVYVSCTVVF